MALIYDHAQTPISGYSFPDPSGYTVKGKTLKDLVAAIKSYRSLNRFHAGNPEAELEAHYLTAAPWLVSKAAPVATAVSNPIDAWLNQAWREAPHKFLELKQTADDRFEHCKKCEHYVSDHSFDMDSTRRLLILGNGKLMTGGVCRVHHWACGLTAWLENPKPKIQVEGCWATVSEPGKA